MKKHQIYKEAQVSEFILKILTITLKMSLTRELYETLCNPIAYQINLKTLTVMTQGE